MRPEHRIRGAFTLIELLIVIGIIALLLSFLLPTMRGVREQGMRIQCQNNMRQIISGSMLYVAEHEGVMPFCNWLSKEPAGRTGWLYTAPIRKPGDTTQVATGALWPYLGGTRNRYDMKFAVFYHCPLDLGPWTGGPSQWMTSYLCNGATDAYGNKKHGTFRLDQMRGDGVWYWEAAEQGVTSQQWNDGSSFPFEGESNRHSTGCCIGCFDGAVQWWTHKEYLVEQARLPGRLWCNPATANGK